MNKLSLGVAGVCVLAAIHSNANAGSLSLSYGELKQPFTYMEQTVTFKPMGSTLLMSFDLNDNWSLDFDYQSFDDNLNHGDEFRSTTDLSSWGAGLNYFSNKWSYGLSYNNSSDKTFAEHTLRPDEHNHEEKTEAESFGLSVGYGWLSGEMFYNLSLSAQMSDWDSDTRETVTRLVPPPPPSQGEGPPPGNNEPPPPQLVTDHIHDVNSGDASSLSASFSVARYWPLQDDTGVMVGGMLAWHHMLSGESVLVSSTGRRPPPHRQGPQGGGPRVLGTAGANVNRAGGNSIGSVSGDDSYGQLAFYLSYDLTENWSVDFDTGIDIGTDDNDTTWSVSLGYFW